MGKAFSMAVEPYAFIRESPMEHVRMPKMDGARPDMVFSVNPPLWCYAPGKTA